MQSPNSKIRIATIGIGGMGSGDTRYALQLPGVELAAVTDSHTYSARRNRMQAAAAMRGQLGKNIPGELLCDGIGNSPRTDAAELAALRGI